MATVRGLRTRLEKLEAAMADAADALDHAVLWIDDFAIPRISSISDDVDGGNSLSAGLAMKAEEIRDLLKEACE